MFFSAKNFAENVTLTLILKAMIFLHSCIGKVSKIAFLQKRGAIFTDQLCLYAVAKLTSDTGPQKENNIVTETKVSTPGR